MKELPKEILDQIETGAINVSWHTISHRYNLSEEFISKECQQFILSNILEDIQSHRIRKSELTRYMRKEYNKYEVLC